MEMDDEAAQMDASGVLSRPMQNNKGFPREQGWHPAAEGATPTTPPAVSRGGGQALAAEPSWRRGPRHASRPSATFQCMTRSVIADDPRPLAPAHLRCLLPQPMRFQGGMRAPYAVGGILEGATDLDGVKAVKAEIIGEVRGTSDLGGVHVLEILDHRHHPVLDILLGKEAGSEGAAPVCRGGKRGAHGRQTGRGVSRRHDSAGCDAGSGAGEHASARQHDRFVWRPFPGKRYAEGRAR